MMRIVLVYLALLAGLFGYMRTASAELYYWQIAYTNPATPYRSADAACQGYYDFQLVNVNGGRTPTRYVIEPSSPPVCAVYAKYSYESSDRRTYSSTLYLRGDECEPGSTYNPETYQCESGNSCSDKTGDSFNFSISGVGSTDYMFITSDGSFSAPSQRGCFDGCSASTVDQSCQTSSLGPWRCGGTAVFDGGNCGEGTESPETPSVTESAELEKPAAELTTENQPCNYITQPDGSQTCTSLSVEDRKGQICGTFNGQVICPQIQPEYDSTQIDTTVTTQDNGDGTTTTTKTDVATVTNCTRTSCNTSTTTNTTINNGGSISGTCTGAQCPTAGNPDGNGDGLGDCVGSCEGSTGPLSLEGMGEGTSFADTLDGYYDRISGSPIASAVTGISMPSNGSCSFPTASTYLFEVDLNFICQNADWLDPLRYVFLAIWAFAAVRVLMSA